MADPRLTEERLKSWLDSNQPQRERLCLHLMPVLGDYFDVNPRRPKGGPDGARDIEAKNKVNETIWGAIGFRNSANDSVEGKKWVSKKFKDDLSNALKQKADLEYFVFFTNVDLTPLEVKKLSDDGYKEGVEKIKVFYREKLRQILDSSKGYGYRLQYLGIEMSKEEQTSFIESIQIDTKKELQEISRQNKILDSKIARLEFLNELNRKFKTFKLKIELDKNYTPLEIKKFIAQASIKKIYEESPAPILNFGLADSYMKIDNTQDYIFGLRKFMYQENPDQKLKNVLNPGNKRKVSIIEAEDLVFDSEFNSLSDFDGCLLDIFISETLLDKLKSISIVINDFQIFNKLKNEFAVAEEVGLNENNPPIIPYEFDKDYTDWKRLYLRNKHTNNYELSPPNRHNSREIHFSEFTPKKMNLPVVRSGRLFQNAVFRM